MAIKDALLAEFDMEMDNTRRALDRLPDDRFGWQPHAKSGTLGWLAVHIATIPHWAKITMEQESLNLADPSRSKTGPPVPKDRKGVLDLFEKNRKEARAALAKGTDAAYKKRWALLMGEKELFREPRASVLRRMVFNHMIHHRGQLTMYFRLLEVPVPGLYGPSADEQKF